MDGLHLLKIDRTLAFNKQVIIRSILLKDLDTSALSLILRSPTSRKEHKIVC